MLARSNMAPKNSSLDPSVYIPGATDVRDYAAGFGGASSLPRRHNLNADRLPSPNDGTEQGYFCGSAWVFGSDLYFCTDPSPGAAHWFKYGEVTDASLVRVSGAESSDEMILVRNGERLAISLANLLGFTIEDNADRDAKIPLFIGQLVVQNNTSDIYVAVGLTAGMWDIVYPAIEAGSITESKLAIDAVTAAKIGPLAVTEGKIGPLAVTEGKIALGAVTAAKLAEDIPTTKLYGEGRTLVQQLVITADTTFVKASYPWLRGILVQIQGGGGGGGGAAATTAGQIAIAGGGGAGAYSESFLTEANIATLDASVNVTVGAGGAGGIGNADGGEGGKSWFGWTRFAGGGKGGLAGAAFAIPGTYFVGYSVPTVDVAGTLVKAGMGTPPLIYPAATGQLIPIQEGASSQLGSGSPAYWIAPSTGINGAGVYGGYGGGGGGAGNSISQASARPGGAGGPGVVILSLYA